MQKEFFRKIVLIVLISLFLFPATALAGTYETADEGTVCFEGLVPCGKKIHLGGEDEDGNCSGPLTDTKVPCQFCHLLVLFNGILDFLWFTVAPTLIAILTIVAGALFFFAGGNPGRIKRAQHIATFIIIGFLLGYGSWLIVNLLFSFLNVKAWTGLTDGGWSEINCEITTHSTYESADIQTSDRGMVEEEPEEDEDNPGMECRTSNLSKGAIATPEMKSSLGVGGRTNVDVYRNWLITQGINPSFASEIANAGGTATIPPVFEGDPTHCWGMMVPTAKVVQRIAIDQNGWDIRVTSGYRDHDYNSSIGGADASYHMRNMALDITTSDTDVSDLYYSLLRNRNNGGWTGGISLYPDENFVHIDTRSYNQTNWTAVE